MDLDSAGTAAKRSRTKKTAVATTATAAKASNARSRKSKAAVEPQTPDPRSLATPAIEVTAMTNVPAPTEDEVTALIRTAAYYIAERRMFQPGHELEDWLQAERQIMGAASHDSAVPA